MSTAHAPNPRVAELFTDLIASLGEIIRTHRVTYAEYRAAVGFLEEVGRTGEFPLLADVFLGVAVDDVNYGADGGTESNLEGPFYLPDAPILSEPYQLSRRDNEPGDILFLSGTVSSVDGTPLAGAVLDIWQDDAQGLYSNIMPGPPEFNLRGRLETDARGAFEVRTVVPSPYSIPANGPTGRLLAELGRHPFRPAHIHVKVSHPEHEPLTTQLYFEGDQWLDSDVVGAVKDSLVLMPKKHDGTDERGVGPYFSASYDFVIRPRAAR